MGTQTLADYTSTGITLTTAGAYQTPFTITQAGTVDVASGDAVDSNFAGVVLLNEGDVFGSLDAVSFQNGGTVTNAGTISGSTDGIYVEFNGGTVTNLAGGTIMGTEAVRLGNGGGVEDTGTDSQSLNNAGVLLGSAADGDVVYVRGSVSSVYNSGTIAGGASGTGMYFLGGGYIGNSGTVSGAYGMILTDDPAIAQTVNNTGTIFSAGRGLIASGGNQTIVNQNLIYGGFKGVIISGSGAALDTLINTGTIASQSFGLVTGTAGDVAIFNQGTIGDGVRLQSSGTDTDFLLNTGTITGTSGIYVYNASGSQTIINQGTISGSNGILLNVIGASTTIENAGTIASTVGANGVAIGPMSGNDGTLTVIVDPGADFIGSVTGGGGVLEFAAGIGSLGGIGAQFFDFATFALDTGAEWTVSGTLDSSSDEVITGFTAKDTIDITNLTVPAVSLVTLSGADMLSLEQDGDTLNLTFSGDAGTMLTLTSDGGAGTLIEEVTCFLRGTRIATARGEVPVEALAIGDTIRTLHAGAQKIKWIGTRRYAAPFCNHAKVLPIQIRAHAIADHVPARDLFVSPGHAICIDDALIHAARLVNGVTITQLQRAETVEYFHIELENHEVIFAENCPAETFMGEYFRQQFQNAESFSALYPGAKAPEIFSVPFLSHGFQLGAILRRLRARAGITVPATPGPLRGYVDEISAASVIGWAQDLAHPDEPVLLDILAGAKRLGRALANIPRPDVAAAGFGRGDHGFEFALPAGTTGRITVRRAADGAALAHATQSQAA